VTTGTLVEAAARRHRLDDWIGTNRLPFELYVRHWFLDREALPELLPRRERRLPIGLGSTSGIWSLGADTERLVRVDVSERPSREDAHRALPQVLAEVQSPVLVRNVDLAIGDVTFALPGGLVVIFARANLVVIVASVGRRPVDAPRIASALDEAIVRRDRAAGVRRGAAAPLSLKIVRERGPVRRVEVDLAPSIRITGLPMVKVFAPPGRLYERRTGLRYRPAEDRGTGWVSVYVHERGLAEQAQRLLMRERS
jgi:hypothetical protein